MSMPLFLYKNKYILFNDAMEYLKEKNDKIYLF